VNTVPFELPQVDLEEKIAIIGSYPRQDDLDCGRPFSGGVGRLLSGVMNSANIFRSGCLLGYACQHFGRFSEASHQKQSSLEELDHVLKDYEPNICVLLGQYALDVAGSNLKIGAARGGLFISNKVDSPFFGRKCIPSYEPIDVIRMQQNMPLLAFDLTRAHEESKESKLVLPDRIFEIGLPASSLVKKLIDLKEGTDIAFDIEGGGVSNISMLSIATSPSSVFHVAPSIYTPSEWKLIFHELKIVLENHKIGKILQNALYDASCLFFQWKILTRGIVDDTMMSGWEIYPELRKSLGVQTSIYTREPPYKADRKTDDIDVFNEYNCKDSAVTFEIREKHKTLMDAQAVEHYQFNMDLLKPVMYMMLKGWNYDQKKADEKGDEVGAEQKDLLAAIETHAEVPLNPNSPKQMIEVIYGRMRFEKQYKKEKGRKTNKLTCGVDALLKLHKDTQHPIIGLILKWRNRDGIRKQLLVKTDEDKRVRCSYIIPGTETGRFTCAKYFTDSGTNLTTITKELRNLYCSDIGHDFFQCDLEGADGWTVAAWNNYFGYTTMLDDYKNIPLVKPAQCIAALYLDDGTTDLSHMPSAEMAQHLETLEIPEWLYFAAKRLQHGTNYGLKPNTMSSILLKDSYKIYGAPIYVSIKDCSKLQDLYISRYPGVIAWQNRVNNEIGRSRRLPCASGHVRRFFGNPRDHNTYKEALSHEPQANTAYATNLALWKLWYDKCNRRPDGTLIVEPLHQVHDALCGQWKSSDREQAIEIVCECFSNTLRIADHDIVIPFEGQWGDSWGNMPNNF